MRPRPVEFPDLFAAASLGALVKLLQRFDARSAERGRRYALDGHVDRLDVDALGNGFAARVQGTLTYDVVWELLGLEWEHSCDCPVGWQCKHAYAAACVMLAHALSATPALLGLRAACLPPALVLKRLPPLRVKKLDLEPFEDEDPFGEGDDDSLDDDELDDDELDDDELDDDEGDDPFDDDDIPYGRPDRSARLTVPRSQAPRSRHDLRPTSARAASASTLGRRPSEPTLEEQFDLLQLDANRFAHSRTIIDIARAAGADTRGLDAVGIGSEPDADLRCFMISAWLVQNVATPLPPPIPSWSQSEPARQKLRSRIEGRLRTQLLEWSSAERAVHEKRLRAAIRLRTDVNANMAISVEPLLTTKRLKDEPRRPEQLRALLDESSRCPGLFSAGSHALLAWFCEFYATGAWWTRGVLPASDLEHMLIAAGDDDLVIWKVGDEAAPHLERAMIRDGAAARLGREGAVIEPVCITGDTSARIELRVRLGNQKELPLKDVVHLKSQRHTEPDYVLADGRVWRIHEKPPDVLVEGFRVLEVINLDPRRDAVTLRRLSARHPAVAKALDPHTLRVASRPVFLLDGESDAEIRVRLVAVPASAPWSPGERALEQVYDLLPVTVASPPACFADVPTDDVVAPIEIVRGDGGDAAEPLDTHAVAGESWQFEYAGNGLWRACGQRNDDAAGGQPWFVEPDVEALAASVEWLERHGGATAINGNSGQVYEWMLTARAPRFESLVQAWECRPKEADYFATRRVRRLLVPLDRPVPRLDIRSSGKDWFEVRLDWQAEGEALPMGLVESLLASDDEFVRLADGWMRAPSRDRLRDAMGALADLGLDAAEAEQNVGLWQLAGARAEAFAELERLGVDSATLEAARELRRRVEAFRGLPRTPVPRSFRGELRGYQRDGLDFLAFTSSLGIGAVLADDMGLGKTVQTLAWLERLRASDRTGGPALVVCPASVMHIWRDEAARFAPKSRVVTMGSGQGRHELWARLDSVDLAITNYALLRLDAERWSDVQLRALILDEAQNVKNPDAASTRAVRALRAGHRLALTGTPLENRTRDVWSIVECVSPGYLGSRKTFEERYDRADVRDADRRLLSAKLRPLLLRRRKSDVATDLPARSEEVRRCELRPEQRRLYLATLRASRRLVSDLERQGRESGKARIQILAALTRMRQICCHPGLVETGLGGAASSKFELLFDLLEPLLDEGHKVLVFSQFARCIQLVATQMKARHLRHFVLTGATQRRERVVAEFQQCAEPAAFLISLKAGGTGLNLTEAGYVILLDPWWNPAVEAQAIDRTHRIGQTRSVMAYRLVAADTIEEKILDLQRDKAALADAVIDDATFGQRLDKSDLARLLDEC